MTKNWTIKTFLAFLIATSLTSCVYRMPAEDDVSMIPNTNNSEIIGNKGSPMMPGANF